MVVTAARFDGLIEIVTFVPVVTFPAVAGAETVAFCAKVRATNKKIKYMLIEEECNVVFDQCQDVTM